MRRIFCDDMEMCVNGLSGGVMVGDPKQQELLAILEKRLKDSGSSIAPQQQKIISSFKADILSGRLVLSEMEFSTLLTALQSPNINATVPGYRYSAIQLLVKINQETSRSIELLKAFNADLNAVSLADPDGQTVLIMAIWLKNQEVAKTLIRLGANVHATNVHTHTPLILAATTGQIDVMESLIAAGAQLDAQTQKGSTALMYAIAHEKREAVETLINRGASVHLSDFSNQTPLRMAVQLGRIDIIELLINADAQLDEQDNNGNTALMRAVVQKKWDIVKLLLKSQASISITNNEGFSAMMMLAMVEDAALLKELRDRYTPKIWDIMIESAKEHYQKRSKAVRLVKETGHILGLASKVADIEPEGLTMSGNYLLLEKYVDMLEKEFRNNDFTQIQQALRVTNESLPEVSHHVRVRDRDNKKLFEQYQQKKPTIFPLEWGGKEKHQIALVVWNDLIILCNRGMGKLDHGISVFKMSRKIYEQGNIENILQPIMPTGGVPSAEQVLKGIRELVEDINHPILTFPSQEQQYGTCGFVNAKVSLKALICFMKLLQPDDSKPITAEMLENFNSRFLEELIKNRGDYLKKIVDDSNGVYKNITKTMRDKLVDTLCTEFEFARSSAYEKLYLDLFAVILNEHHGQSVNRKGRKRPEKNINAERERAFKILPVMTPKERQEIFQSTSILNNLENFLWWIQKGMLDIHTKNRQGYTAMELAKQNNNVQTMEILKAIAVADSSLTTAPALPSPLPEKETSSQEQPSPEIVNPASQKSSSRVTQKTKEKPTGIEKNSAAVTFAILQNILEMPEEPKSLQFKPISGPKISPTFQQQEKPVQPSQEFKLTSQQPAHPIRLSQQSKHTSQQPVRPVQSSQKPKPTFQKPKKPAT